MAKSKDSEEKGDVNYFGVILREIDIKDKTGDEIIREIVDLAIKEGGDVKGLKGVAFTQPANPGSKWSLKLKNVTLGKALAYVTNITSLRCIESNGLIVFSPIEKLDGDVVLTSIELTNNVRLALGIDGGESEEVLKNRLKKLKLRLSDKSSVRWTSNASAILVELSPTEAELLNNIVVLINRGACNP
jgi:hypothetical protein